MSDEQKIAEALIKQNVITAEQLKKAVEFRDSLGGGAIQDLVVKLGYAKESEVSAAIASVEQVSAADITAHRVDVAVMNDLPQSILDKHVFVVLKAESASGPLKVAMEDPNNFAAIEEIQFLTNRAVEPLVAPKSAIRRALQLWKDGKAAAAAASARSARVEGLADELAKHDAATLLRAWLLARVKAGDLDEDALLAALRSLEG